MSLPTHAWRFFRAGGFDQVRLDSAADLLAIGELDQKLWVALSCPTKGIEFDERSLALIDSDGDGHIRAPELISAVAWAAEHLADTEVLAQGLDGVPLAAIRADGDAGNLRAAAKSLLAALGTADAPILSVAAASEGEAQFNALRFNGDGVIDTTTCEDEALAGLVEALVTAYGGVAGRNGVQGIDRPLFERSVEEAQALASWRTQAKLPLGDATAAAFAAVDAVREKLEDYFVRCRLVAFDARATESMNGSEENLKTIAAQTLSDTNELVAALPLAYARAGAELPLVEGINPAWAAAIRSLHDDAIAPLLGARESLSEADWRKLLALLDEHAAWLAAKPSSALDSLPEAVFTALLAPATVARVNDLLAQDEARRPEAEAIAAVERLARYCRDLLPLANNFVSFRNFYTRQPGEDKWATFQLGTLFLDGRSAELCVAVNDAAKHAALANLARICLVYCDCVRKGEAGEEKMSIAAAFTAGDADQLMVGRNGVFYDRKGRDWDASITRIIDHPISLRQAFWGPYRRVIRMINEQMQKFAAARAAQAETRMVLEASKRATAVPEPAKAAPMDVGRFVGIFAAIGLALGAIGTALASVVTGLLALKWWQMPLAILGAILIVSGPAVILAWFKLRSRNLGPLLDANGWAINARARINIPFGTSLTRLAQLPVGAERSLSDPYAEKRTPWGIYIILLVVVAALVYYLFFR